MYSFYIQNPYLRIFKFILIVDFTSAIVASKADPSSPT